ncbi:MAG TPA: GntR family transcriptional regulator [Solirubrobacterales bacterium]|nr:GntR family transcriptional regulator [Solirubrobacterales bacterium]
MAEKATDGAVATPHPAPVEQLDNRLLAARARAEILAAIFEGRFDGKLPSEDKLAAMLNISRTTVRTALQSLERDGVVTRQRAIGTLINPHVRPSSLALQRMAGFDGLLEERGFDVDVDISWEWARPDDGLLGAFPLEPDQEYLLIDKAYRADGTLALSILDVVPRSSLLSSELPAEIDASLFAYSERAWTAPIHHAVVKLVPEVKNGDNTQLEIEDGVPFLRLHEVHYSARGEALAYSVISADDKYISLEVVRTQ